MSPTPESPYFGFGLQDYANQPGKTSNREGENDASPAVSNRAFRVVQSPAQVPFLRLAQSQPFLTEGWSQRTQVRGQSGPRQSVASSGTKTTTSLGRHGFF